MPDISDPIWNMASLLIGVLGVLLAIVFYKRGKRESQLSYAIGGHQLIGPADSASPWSTTDMPVTITCAGAIVTSVTKIYISIWNSGQKTLDWASSNITEEPLQLRLPGALVLGEPKKLSETRQSVHFDARKVAEDTVAFTFSFLDHDDGAMFEILWGGPVERVRLAGAFKASKGLRYVGELRKLPRRSTRDRFAYALLPIAKIARRHPLSLSLGAGGLTLLLVFAPVVPVMILFVTVMYATLFTMSRLREWLDAPGTAAVPRALARIPVPPFPSVSRRQGWLRRLLEDVWVAAEADESMYSAPLEQVP